MTNFDFDTEKLINSSLLIKASGSIIQEIEKDLNLPEGEKIESLLKDEKNQPSKNSQNI